MTGHGGKSGAEFTADEEAHRDAQPMTALCAFCRWRFVGLAGEARARALAHRKEKHPEAARKKRAHRKGSFRIRR